MTQNMTGMPETAEFRVRGYLVTIENHEVENWGGLLDIMWCVTNVDRDKDILSKFEKHGVSFAAAIKCLIQETSSKNDMIARALQRHYGTCVVESEIINQRDKIIVFIKNPQGELMMKQFTDKIKKCNNWIELYDVLDLTSRFQRDAAETIRNKVEDR